MAKKKEEVIEEVIEVIEEDIKIIEACNVNDKEIELARLRKLHADQVELGINPASKLEILISQLEAEIKQL